MTPDRIVHGIVALMCVAFFLWLRRPHRRVPDVPVIAAMALLGSWLPDWDLVLGIGFHRSPVTHSALPLVAFVLATRNWQWVHAATGLALGIASHLLWDTVDYGNVVGIPGGDADRMFLLSNAALLVIAAIWMTRRRPLATGHGKLVDEDAPPIPPGVVEEARRIAIQEVVEEEERQFANGKPMNIDRLSYITIFFSSALLIGYFVAAAISNG